MTRTKKIKGLGWKTGPVIEVTVHKRYYGKGLEYQKAMCGEKNINVGWFAVRWKDVNCSECKRHRLVKDR